MSDDSWEPMESISIEEALAAGIPKETIIAAWREADHYLGTNMTDTLIQRYFGDEGPCT